MYIYIHLYTYIYIYIFIKTLQCDRLQEVYKNDRHEILQNILFWVEWAILAQLWPKIMQACMSESSLEFFSQTLQPDKTQ